MLSRREWIKASGAGLLGAVLGASEARGQDTPGGDEMIVVPAGPFLMGTGEEQIEALARRHGYHPSWFAGELPLREVDLPAYAIDRCPVTNRQYAQFRAATGHKSPPHWHGPAPPEHMLDHPVVFVCHADATAYADWAGKRLPTEAEWEKAARGERGLIYPWGDDFDPGACRWNPDPTTLGPGTAPVAAHPRGASPYGVLDMAGNVGEWCADSPGPGSAFIKGGCWLTTNPVNLRPAGRTMSGFANNRSDFVGFRCAKGVG